MHWMKVSQASERHDDVVFPHIAFEDFLSFFDVYIISLGSCRTPASLPDDADALQL